MDKFCFIITRCVRNKKTDKYWKECCRRIRTFHKEKIIIIDDGSDPDFVSKDIEFDNTDVMTSEYPKRGEILPYYYFYHNKWAEHAVILHDSTFLQRQLSQEHFVEDVRFLWHFTNMYISPTIHHKIMNHPTLRSYIDGRQKWVGCFGVQSIISHEFLTTIYVKYRLNEFLHIIKNRNDRMDFERVFAFICINEFPKLLHKPSICGNIYTQHQIFYYLDFTIYEKLDLKTKRGFVFLKCFTGR